MEKNVDAKAERILSIYSRLKQGIVIRKAEESVRYGVTERTIQRDIEDIRCFLQNLSNETGEIQEVASDRQSGGYRLEMKVQTHLNEKEVLAICKVLLDSRSLVKEEMFPIIHKLLDCCSDDKERKLVKEYIGNEKHHYIELQHGKKLIERIWKLEQAIKEQRHLEIRYKKVKDAQEVIRKVKPVGIMFSEFYYYLTAYIEDIDREKEFQNPDDPFPTIYRVDRLEEVKVLEERFTIPYSERFEEGEFRKRIQFMYGGRLRKVRFKYVGHAVDFVLDKLPTAQIIRKDAEGYVIQAEVFGDGIDMWMKSQKDIGEVQDGGKHFDN